MQPKITKDEVFRFLKNSGKVIGGLAIDAYGNALNQIEEKSFLDAIEIGIENTIASLYEANVNDNEIVRIVGEYWGLCKDDVVERIIWEKQQATIRSLNQYLKLQGYSKEEINQFMKEEKAIFQIRCNKDLWKLKNNPEKLVKEIKSKK